MVSSALDHNKPRVLVSGLSNGLGGTEIVVGRYIKALSSYATFEFLATSDLSDVAFVHEMNSEIHICPDIDRPIKRFEYLDHLFQDEPNRYQAVWCNFNHLLYADVLRAAQRANVSVRIAHSHNSRFLGGLPTQVISRFNRRAALRNSNVRLACSKEAGSFFWGDNFQVLPNALNFNDMEYDPVSRVVIREEFGLSSKDFLIGTVGRLTSQKNHIFLLKIMKELLTVKSNCKLMIVGDGPLHKNLQESAAKLGISSSVLFAGERKDIKDILSSFDCFVFPSTFEGLGVAAIEAQLNGLPCVCSFGVPDAADISDKFLKCSFNVAEWIDAIISMGRPNKLAGGASVYDVNKQAGKLLSIFLGRQSSRERDCADV